LASSLALTDAAIPFSSPFSRSHRRVDFIALSVFFFIFFSREPPKLFFAVGVVVFGEEACLRPSDLDVLKPLDLPLQWCVVAWSVCFFATLPMSFS